MGYFAVRLKNNNKEMDFQQNCNNIDYTSSKNYVIFANKNDDANKYFNNSQYKRIRKYPDQMRKYLIKASL